MTATAKTINTKPEKPSYIHVQVGDIVGVVFDSIVFNDLQGFVGEVIKVQKRPGLINDGSMSQAPVITLRRQNGELEYLDNSFIQAVFQRAKKHPAPTNIFRDAQKEGCFTQTHTNQKGIACGTLLSLTVRFLAQLPIALEREINYLRLKELFNKQTPGLIKQDRMFYWVSKKAFSKWVKKNALRICMTADELRKEETKINQSWEDDYWSSAARELLEDDENENEL